MKKIFLLMLIAALLISCGGSKPNTRSPNIIVFLADDMDVKLMPFMKNVDELITRQGATLTNYITTTPLCCPSRSSMLTGEYAHNTNVLENSPGFRMFLRRGKEADTFAVWLHNAGYKTSLLGKYLNVYPIGAGRDHVPAGWDDWRAFLYQKGDADFYYNYAMNENGTYKEYGSAPENYSTDVIKSKGLSFLNERKKDNAPFFMLFSVYAPHGPSEPAPRHADLYPALQYQTAPSANEDISDKPSAIQQLANLGDEVDSGDANTLFRRRAQSLAAVDEMVAEVVQALEQNHMLENTYIIFTSDNGFHIGEHGFPTGKGLAYEEDIRVPFVIRGPGIPAGLEISQLTANIDLAPTFADMAGIPHSPAVDGRSLLPLLQNQPVENWRSLLLIQAGYMDKTQSADFQNVSLQSAAPVYEYSDSPYDDFLWAIEGGAYRGIRGETFVYVEYENGEAEYYDLLKDPYQMENTVNTLDEQYRANLSALLQTLKTCHAEECRAAEQTQINK